MSPDLDIAVVGAGMAGLAAAYALHRSGRSVHVFEAAAGVGGRMATEWYPTGGAGRGYGVEAGATHLPGGRRATWRLLRELGLPRRDVPMVGGAVGVWRDGRVHVLGVGHPFGRLASSPSVGRTHRHGMDAPARALAERVPVSTGVAVREVIAGRDQARLVIAGSTPSTLNARTVLLCVPAPSAAALYLNPTPAERVFVDACRFTPTVRVTFLLDRPLAPPACRPLHTLLVPATDGGLVSGVMVDHVRNPALVPSGRGSVTVLTSSAAAPALLDLPVTEVAAVVADAAMRYLPGLAGAVVGWLVHRFPAGLPVATPEAARLQPGFFGRELRCVEHAGDWVLLRPGCEFAVRAGQFAAHRVLARPLPLSVPLSVPPPRTPTEPLRAVTGPPRSIPAPALPSPAHPTSAP